LLMKERKKHRLDVHFKSNKSDWGTPDAFFEQCAEIWGPFDLDAAACKLNTKCPNFYTEADDALSQPWWLKTWVNPPYGRNVTGLWVQKGYEESRGGKNVTMLLPARTDTTYFHSFILGKADIYFVKGRLKFKGAKDSAPFPSMIVHWPHDWNTRDREPEIGSIVPRRDKK
jgi:phage N-6-adenine-methyltransferase